MAKVVVVGGGFCGLAAARKCLSEGFEVVLIDPKGWFEFTPSILKVMTNEGYEERIKVPYTEVLSKAEVVRGLVSRVSRSFVFVGETRIRFDYLVLCPGAYTEVPAASFVSVVKRLSDVVPLRKRLKDSGTVAVCGGGQVGIEVAAELASAGKEVFLLHGSSRLIERAPVNAGMAAHRCLAAMGVDVRLNEPVSGVKDGCVVTSKGSLRADLILWCTGVKPEVRFLRGSGLLSRSEKGVDVLRVNRSLQARDNVFAGGDAADLQVEKTAQNAEIQGWLIGENISRLAKGRPLRTYRAAQTPMLIDLCRTGIFVWKGVVIQSLLFRWLKKAVEVREMLKLRYL